MTPDAHERRSEFCARLKGARERRATPLCAIAETTKVKASLLEALERGDVSRWPKGIYRRSFFRNYVTAIGLPADQHVAEFIELFPDGEDTPLLVKTNGRVHHSTDDPLRLTFADDASSWTLSTQPPSNSRLRAVIQQTVAAAADVLVVVALAALLKTWLGSFLPAVGIVGCVYYSVFTALYGRSLAALLLAHWDQTSTSLSAFAARIEQGARSLEMRELVRQALRGKLVLHESLSRLSAPPRSAKAERRRDPAERRRDLPERRRDPAAVRRQRIESANSSSVDEITEVLG